MAVELQVEQLLIRKHINYRLIKLSQTAYTVDDVVKYSLEDIDPTEICKTIILRGTKTGHKVAILLRAQNKVDFRAAKKLFGEEMTMASSEEVKDTAGVEPGAVCPFLLACPLMVDTRVVSLQRLNCGSGDHLYGLEFRFADLAKAVNYTVVDLAKDGSSPDTAQV